jgi:hypothetical protein
MHMVKTCAALAGLLLSVLLAGTPVRADLAPAIKADLTNSKYVYIATSRKNGSFGKPAEIWFMYRDGAVYVASPPTTWRVRRIKAGRPLVKIAVGKPDGPSFMATGALVNEPNVYPVLFETYAKKYPDGWPKFEEQFRKGFTNGSRVLIRYVPKDEQ